MLETLRAAVVRCAQAAEAEGLCRWRSGNFSALDEDSGLICVTPSGVERRTMTPADVVVMDRDARVVEAAEGRKPSSEALMHIAAYEARPDIRAVVHRKNSPQILPAAGSSQFFGRTCIPLTYQQILSDFHPGPSPQLFRK